MKLMLDTQKEQVLQQIKDIFKQEEDIDFWENLAEEDRVAIDEGLNQLDKKQYISHEATKKEIGDRFNF